MSLALATLIYEWRRYLAAIIALAFSGMMVLAFSGLFAGIIHAELATWERSRADIVVLAPNVKAIVNNGGGDAMPSRIKPLIYLNPEVVDVEPIRGGGAQWINTPRPGEKRVQMWIQTFGIEPYVGSVTVPRDFTDAERTGLMEPGAVAIDASGLKQLGVKLGDEIALDHHSAHVRVILHGYQSPEQPIVVMSDETMRLIGQTGDPLLTGPLMVSVRDPRRATIVRDQLNAVAHGAYRAWTLKEFNQANEAAIMGEQIIGLLLGFSVFLAGLIGIGVTSQTLRGAILSNIREFASLRALGIAMGSLRLIVMELSFWVGIAGLVAALLLTGLICVAAGSIGLPLVIRAPTTIFVCAMMMVIAIISGAMAMGILKKSQPADLLR